MLGGRAEVDVAPEGFAVDETGTTLLQNALLKAWALRPQVPADRLVVADDSGLEVRALGGRPGVHSARYAGPDCGFDDNNRLLLSEMDGVQDRRAAFVCVLVALSAGGELAAGCGLCPGDIATAPRGEHGFGYDPVFIPRGMGTSMAELTPGQKNAISHRGRAARMLATALGIAE